VIVTKLQALAPLIGPVLTFLFAARLLFAWRFRSHAMRAFSAISKQSKGGQDVNRRRRGW